MANLWHPQSPSERVSPPKTNGWKPENHRKNRNEKHLNQTGDELLCVYDFDVLFQSSETLEKETSKRWCLENQIEMSFSAGAA